MEDFIYTISDRMASQYGVSSPGVLIVRPSLIISKSSWRSGEVPEGWKKANVTPIFKKDKNRDPVNYRMLSLTSISSKGMKEIMSDTGKLLMR